MDLSVAIVSWNTRELLDQCLRSIHDSTVGIEFEVIVVDNASSDGSAEMVRESYPNARLIANAGNAGFAAANNQAFEASSGRYLMMLNPDTIVHSGLQGAVEFLDAHPEAAVVGCKSLNPDGSIQVSWNTHYPGIVHDFLPGSVKQRLRSANPAVDVERVFAAAWVGGVCMTVRRTAAENVGLLDVGYFIYTEETDWCRRFADAGWRVMHAPCVTITHFGGQSTNQVAAKMQLELAKSKLRFVSKFGSPAKARVYARALLASASARLVFSRLTSIAQGGNDRAERIAVLGELVEAYRELCADWRPDA